MVVSEYEDWYCVLQVYSGHTHELAGTCIVRGSSSSEHKVWKPVLDGERVTGHIEISFDVTKQ